MPLSLRDALSLVCLYAAVNSPNARLADHLAMLPHRQAIDQALHGTTTVLYMDIEGSTDLMLEVGETAWGAILDRHNALCGEILAQYRGVSA
jgi:class 3 adenylate cyclase